MLKIYLRPEVDPVLASFEDVHVLVFDEATFRKEDETGNSANLQTLRTETRRERDEQTDWEMDRRDRQKNDTERPVQEEGSPLARRSGT
ncbi:hypothetical protein O3P69_006812 [Scylla paramamosain]|uniref:Uncharacterized protein n=1 Tax=Scylla paramamosain TaxID=85552 RepID=A0AAW0U5V1_SCYPA